MSALLDVAGVTFAFVFFVSVVQEVTMLLTHGPVMCLPSCFSTACRDTLSHSVDVSATHVCL